MMDLINRVRPSGTSLPKGMAQMFRQIPRMGMDAGHITNFQGYQTNLQRKINEYRNGGCGEPPPDVLDWATRPAPNGAPAPTWAKYAVVGGAVVVVGATAIFAPEFLPWELELALAP